MPIRMGRPHNIVVSNTKNKRYNIGCFQAFLPGSNPLQFSSLKYRGYHRLRNSLFSEKGARYAYLVFIVTTIGVLIRIPANSNGISVFTEFFLDSLDLSRGQLSAAYMIGNLLMAFGMPAAGRYYDHKGPRASLLLGSIGMAASFLALAGVTHIHQYYWPLSSNAMMLLMCVLYSATGFFGQGIITSSCRNLLVSCFPYKRGAVSVAQNLILTGAFSVAPLMILGLLSEAGLIVSLVIIAITCGLSYALLVFYTISGGPHIEKKAAKDDSPTRLEGMDFSAARSTPVFWLYASTLAFPFFFSGALTFNAIAIFGEFGRSETDAYAWLIPSTFISICTMTLAGLSSDRRGIRGFMVLLNAGYALSTLGVALLHSNIGLWLLIIGFGVGGGFRISMATLAFIRVFGPKSLGAITGLGNSIALAAGAAGPITCVALYSLTGSYSAAFAVISLVPTALSIWSIFQPKLPTEN